MYIIKDIEDIEDLRDINLAVHNELSEAHNKGDINNYLPADRYASEELHPDGAKVASKYSIDKVNNWKPYILKHINVDYLEELTEDWTEELE